MDVLNTNELAGSIRSKINNNFDILTDQNSTLLPLIKSSLPFVLSNLKSTTSPINSLFSSTLVSSIKTGINNSTIFFLHYEASSSLPQLSFSVDGGNNWGVSGLPSLLSNAPTEKLVVSSDSNRCLVDEYRDFGLGTNRCLTYFDVRDNSWTTLYEYQSFEPVDFSANGDFSQLFIVFKTQKRVFCKHLNSSKTFTKTINSITTASNGLITIACLNGDRLQISKTAGATWSPVLDLPSANWLGANINSDGSYIVAWTYNTVYFSSDCGLTWNSQATPTQFRSIDFVSQTSNCLEGNMLIAIPNNQSALYFSFDFNQTWSKCAILTTPSSSTRYASYCGNGNFLISGFWYNLYLNFIVSPFDSVSKVQALSNFTTFVQLNSAEWVDSNTIFNEIINNFLPLVGGTITQTLQVSGNAFFNQTSTAPQLFIKESSISNSSLPKEAYDFTSSNFALVADNILTDSIGFLDYFFISFNFEDLSSFGGQDADFLSQKMEIFNLNGTSAGFIPLYELPEWFVNYYT